VPWWPGSPLCPPSRLEASNSEFEVTDSEFGASEARQRFTFTRQGAVPAPEVTRDTIQDVTPEPVHTTTTNNLEPIDFDFDLGVFNEDRLITIDSNNQDFDLPKSNFVETDALFYDLQLNDEGYLSSGSPSGSDNIQEDNVNVENILDFEVLPEAEFILDTSILPISQQDNTTWTPDFVMNIDPATEPELYETILSGPGGGNIKKVNKRHAVRHRRGAARLDEKEIKDEEHKWNVTRCRQYREQLKAKEQSEMTELEELEQENARLSTQEENMRERLARAKEAYLDLIVKGRVRFIK